MTTEPAPEPKPRGRAAAEVRAGRFIRDFLERVGEASIAQTHQALKSRIGLLNLRRAKAAQLRGPTYASFYRYFAHIRKLGLVEFVREEPTVDVPHEKLRMVRRGAELGAAEVVSSQMQVYRLSAAGRSDVTDALWEDPLARTMFRQMMQAALQQFLLQQQARQEEVRSPEG